MSDTKKHGNGARGALIDSLMEPAFDLRAKEYEQCCDVLLAALWVRGFKVVPLEASDKR